MTVFDYVVLGTIALSILVSVMRGVVREVLALLSWVVAFWIASTFSVHVEPLLPGGIPGGEPIRLLVALVALFLSSLLLMSLVAIAASEFIKALGLASLDKGLGAVFGFVRGVLIVCIGVMLAGLTALPKSLAWQNAMFSAPLEALVQNGKALLPDDLAKRVQFE